jgi:hypothetical protein
MGRLSSKFGKCTIAVLLLILPLFAAPRAAAQGWRW